MLRLLCVTAHPDDEAGAFGGILSRYSDAGVECSVNCLTAGERATNRGAAASDESLKAMRCKEFAAACRHLGVSHCQVLDYPDGALDRSRLPRRHRPSHSGHPHPASARRRHLRSRRLRHRPPRPRRGRIVYLRRLPVGLPRQPLLRPARSGRSRPGRPASSTTSPPSSPCPSVRRRLAAARHCPH